MQMHLAQEGHSIRRAILMWLAAASVLFLAAKASSGQTPPPPTNDPAAKKAPTAQTHPNNPELWNVDAMMEEAVSQIARRYNLNTAQENYTRLLLTKRTRAFLETYETDVRELLKESIEWRLGTKPPTVESYVKWAGRAAPIYQAAAKAILDGNEEWDSILNEDQKKIHTADVALMKSNFAGINKTMEEWQSGKTPAGAKPVSPDINNGLATGPRPGEVSKVSPHPPSFPRKVPEDSWLAYVNLFIDAYKLDEKQAVAAREKIHKESNDMAVKYRERYKKEFEAVAADPKPTAKTRQESLDRPLKEMFVSMDRRLDQLLDSKQRAAISPEKKKQLDENYAALAGRPHAELYGQNVKLRPVATSSQPATDAAAKSEPKAPAATEKPATSKPAD